MSMPDVKIIYSFKIKNMLELQGFKPLLETDNPRKKNYKCWLFEASPALLEAFDRILREEGHNG